MWPALTARLLTGARVIYDSHELWADRNGRPEWRRWLLVCERVFTRSANAVITSSPGYADELRCRYGLVTRPTVVRNIPKRMQTLDPSSIPSRWEIAYIGGLMPGRGLEPTLEALTLLEGVSLRVIGDGSADYVSELHRRAREHGVDGRVFWAGRLSPAGAVRAAAGAGVGLCLIEPICRSYELTLPNKLFEYAAAGVPVLGSDLPVIADVIRTHGLGEVTDGEPVRLAAAVMRLLEPRRAARTRTAVTRFAASHTWKAESRVLAAAYQGHGGPQARRLKL